MNFVSVSLIVAAAGRSLPPESNVANAEFQLSLKALDIPPVQMFFRARSRTPSPSGDKAILHPAGSFI